MMKQKIANGSYLIVEPCVGFDGFGINNVFSIDILDNGNFYIQMKAKCCICESEITVSDVICPYIPTTPTWVHHIAHCDACGTSQLKKYRYWLEEETE